MVTAGTTLAEVSLLWQAVERWRTLVRLRREQFERLLGTVRGKDDDAYWSQRAASYYENVRRQRDPGPIVAAVLGATKPGDTVLDVGGGFGAVAVPVAEAGRQVTVVDPSGSMLEYLWRWAAEVGVSDRVAALHSRWEDAEVAPHDVVVCAHVLYPIEDVVLFLTRLRAAARSACLVALRSTPPENGPAELFAELHGEERVPQPAFGDLCAVLGELGWMFEASIHAADSTWSFDSLEEAVDSLAHSLLVGERGAGRGRLRRWAQQHLRAEGGRLLPPRPQANVGIARLGLDSR
jgi:2-polyprenyl-3-methyl-5-hydroxy-6-metoxy-1,4-benzoquinol methylase